MVIINFIFIHWRSRMWEGIGDLIWRYDMGDVSANDKHLNTKLHRAFDSVFQLNNSMLQIHWEKQKQFLGGSNQHYHWSQHHKRNLSSYSVKQVVPQLPNIELNELPKCEWNFIRNANKSSLFEPFFGRTNTICFPSKLTIHSINLNKLQQCKYAI